MPVINPVNSVPGEGPAPCGWIIDPAATGCCTGWDDYTDQQQHTGAVLAASWMWAATGRQFGQCEVTVEACTGAGGFPTYEAFPVAYQARSGGGYVPYLMDGVWFNAPAGASWCCDTLCEVRLPGPIYGTAAILEVSTGGTVLEPGDYRVYDGVKLVRTDGQCWPACCNAAAGGALTVNYLLGLPVPDDVSIAANMLACEFAAACSGGKCRLPRTVSSMTQMGTTVDFSALPAAGIPTMATGIYEIDQVVKTYNPYGLAMPPKLYNPNRPRVRWPM
jgi:hypothetical protein